MNLQNRYPDGRYMKEEGLVRGAAAGRAVVETTQQEACTGCSAQGACHAMGGGKQRVINAINDIGAQVGDRVIIAAPRKGVLSAAFLVYMVPVLALIAGAVTGQRLASSWGMSPTSAAALLGGAGLLISWMGVKWFSKKIENHASLTVRVVRVLAKGEVDAVDQCAAGL